MTREQHMVTAEQNKIRIDKLLADLLPDVSRSRIRSWIDQELVLVNGKVAKANYKCWSGDTIEWMIPDIQPLSLEAENIPLDILYEDCDLLVVNKPKGMVVHPSAGHKSGTLVNALLFHCDDLSGINGVERPGIVHRIDKDTSGLLVVAKKDAAHASLADQLAKKDVERKYEAIVHGVISHETGVIDAPIGRDPNNRQRMAVVEGGKKAVTHFSVMTRFKNFTHVACRLETGRTHQIRVHMKYIGHPLVGDSKYGPSKTMSAGGQALHAKTLCFTHPSTNEWLQFEADVPKEFADLLERIEKMY